VVVYVVGWLVVPLVVFQLGGQSVCRSCFDLFHFVFSF
jgi:hypothetical protein